MTRVAVKPEMLRWARDRAGRGVEELRERFPKIDEWETAETQPTVRQLEDYARATFTPFGYFFLDQPPDERLAIPNFRSKSGAPTRSASPNLLETMQTMQRRQAWLREHQILTKEPPLDFVGMATPETAPEAVAADIRQRLGFDPLWASAKPNWTAALLSLREAMDGIGIIVATNGVVGNNTHRPLDVNEFRGFVLVDQFAPLVFVNGKDAKAAQMFTLAHELAHIWYGQSAVFDLAGLQPAETKIERACDRVAAEFLVPAEFFGALWQKVRVASDPFAEAARHFKVSAIVAARRALDLRLIERDSFFEFLKEQEAAERQRAEEDGPSGGNFYATQNVRLGRRFAHAVVNAVEEGRLPYREAYALTGISGKTFDNYARELRGEPRR